MAKRSSKADTGLFVLLVIVGVPIFLISKVVDSIGGAGAVILAIAVLGFVIWYRQDKKKKRLEYLRAKYGDDDVVQKIVEGYIWQGQSEEQLKDSMGAPVATDRNVLKTKTKEVWKYHQQGTNRFGLRVTVENGYVTGWDKKA